METFSSNGVGIAYERRGQGPPVLLIHGFASNARINWASTGWIGFLVDQGFEVITFDNRGHGESEKLYDPEAYKAPTMAMDAVHLLDHLGIERAHVMGYSMGARITAFMLLDHGARVISAVLAGLAENIFTGVGMADEIADALEADSPGDIVDERARMFRQFADATRSDLAALAACMRAGRPAISRRQLATVSHPVLVVAGEDDDIAGPVAPLVEALPNARGVTLAGRDHMKAVGDRTYKQAVAGFLSQFTQKSSA